MEPPELLRHTAQVLERLAVPYLVTGSTATIAYGEPRFTNDIDIVAALRLDQVEPFCQAFPPPEFYCSIDAGRDAVQRCFQFNIIQPGSGLKVDVMIPADTPFNRSRLGRGIRLQVKDDLTVCFASPEDVILKKLEYYRKGGSDKHLRDIAGVLKIRGARLERDYIALWAERLGLAELWRQVLDAVPNTDDSPSGDQA